MSASTGLGLVRVSQEAVRSGAVGCGQLNELRSSQPAVQEPARSFLVSVQIRSCVFTSCALGHGTAILNLESLVY